MSTAPVAIKFVVGSRNLVSVPRLLDTVAFGLAELVGGAQLDWPEVNPRAEGLRVLSAPLAATDAIVARYPSYLMGGFQAYDRHYIRMDGVSYAAYLGKFSSKTRSTLKRKQNKLAEMGQGALDVRAFNRESDVERFMADAVPLSRRTYQGRLLGAGLPEGPDAIADMKKLAREDNLRAYILYLHDRPVSYLYLPIIGSTVVYAHLGYDPDAAALSVGTVLQLTALERLFAEQRYRFFDFTEGTGAHKKLFGTDCIQACSFFMLRPGLKNRVLVGSLSAFNSVVATCKRVAERSGKTSRIRAMLRANK
ncbi:MAG TPA: GNAT family N-acetyltransferase [Rhodanobacteraceae bacterium]